MTYVSSVSAQVNDSFQLKGTLRATDTQKVDEVTIQLVSARDRKLVKMEFPDASGKFLFSGIQAAGICF
jgi:hypothetical protein